MKCTIASFCFSLVLQLPSPVTVLALRSAGQDYTNNCGSRDLVINICGSVCIPGAKHGMLELIPQTLFFLERASANKEGGSGYPRLLLSRHHRQT